MRLGKCNRCGQCCKFARLFYNCDPKTKSFLYKGAGQDKIQIMLKCGAICPNLELKNNLPTCKIYKTRPSFCKEFPQSEIDIKGLNCNYKFIKFQLPWKKKQNQ